MLFRLSSKIVLGKLKYVQKTFYSTEIFSLTNNYLLFNSSLFQTVINFFVFCSNELFIVLLFI